ncbi:hypothetical protein [Curvibacter phage PCA1]|nr:hypothetical protein [Curvibacter phage PCA1]
MSNFPNLPDGYCLDCGKYIPPGECCDCYAGQLFRKLFA